MNVVSFLGGIPPRNQNPDKPMMLKLFAEGVNKVGDKGIVHEGMTYQNCDVAVLQGFVHEHGKNAPHLSFRKQVLDMNTVCLLYTSPSPRDQRGSRMPSSA